jgi:hypothetical protein
VDLDRLHASENLALDASSFLVQSFESVPLSLLKLRTSQNASAEPPTRKIQAESSLGVGNDLPPFGN